MEQSLTCPDRDFPTKVGERKYSAERHENPERCTGLRVEGWGFGREESLLRGLTQSTAREIKVRELQGCHTYEKQSPPLGPP